MIPGLADQIREAVASAIHTVMVQRGLGFSGVPRSLESTGAIEEMANNAAGTIVLQIHDITEELLGARVEISEATRALDTCGVPGAGSLAERIRIKPAAIVRLALAECLDAIRSTFDAINEGTLDMVHMPDDDSECPEDDTCECSISETTTKLNEAYNKAKEALK